MQDALVVKPVATLYFAHDHQQVVGRSISVGRVSDQLAEKAGCIRDRNTHQSGDIRFGRLRQGYIATRAKWSVEQLQRQPTRFAIRQSFRIVWVEQLQPFRELWYAQAIHARCFDSFPLFLNFRI